MDNAEAEDEQVENAYRPRPRANFVQYNKENGFSGRLSFGGLFLVSLLIVSVSFFIPAVPILLIIFAAVYVAIKSAWKVGLIQDSK